MITIFVHREGRTERATSIDRAWLIPATGAWVWVDLAAPSIPESLVLSDTFAFHPLSVEDAMASLHYPKIEPYDGYLYAILHGIDFHPGEAGFGTHDVDFFLGASFLVTVHDGPSLPQGEIIAPTVGDHANDLENYHNNFQDPERFLKAGGMRGRQLQVLVEGTYYINRLFATVEMIPVRASITRTRLCPMSAM